MDTISMEARSFRGSDGQAVVMRELARAPAGQAAVEADLALKMRSNIFL